MKPSSLDESSDKSGSTSIIGGKWQEHVELEALIGIRMISRDGECEGMDEILVGLTIERIMLMSKLLFCNKCLYS